MNKYNKSGKGCGHKEVQHGVGFSSIKLEIGKKTLVLTAGVSYNMVQQQNEIYCRRLMSKNFFITDGESLITSRYK